MDAVLDGNSIETERDVHRALARQLDFGQYYGHNLDALWDRLSTDVERPARIVWNHTSVSKERLGVERFAAIVQILRRAEQEDIDTRAAARLEVILND